MKPITTIAAAMLGVIALAHLYRLIQPFEVVVGATAIPQWVSGAAVVVAGALSLGLWREARSR